MSSSDGGVEVGVAQEHQDVVPNRLWWWLACISIAAVAVLGNLVFLLTVIYNRWGGGQEPDGTFSITYASVARERGGKKKLVTLRTCDSHYTRLNLNLSRS